MGEEFRQIRILIFMAAIMGIILVGYNLFFVPEIQLVSVSSSAKTVSEFCKSESYHAQNSKLHNKKESFSQTAKVNINKADKEQLQSLPGIGPGLAQRIIKYRQKNGPFNSAEELLAVKGIGKKKLKKLLKFLIF